MNGTGDGASTLKRTARQWQDPLSSIANLLACAPPYHRTRGERMARKPPALAKITPPRLHDVLARTRLFEALDAALQRPVAWLSAQPGAGKTTLVATYLQARARRALWYQVDDGDADAASF